MIFWNSIALVKKFIMKSENGAQVHVMIKWALLLKVKTHEIEHTNLSVSLNVHFRKFKPATNIVNRLSIKLRGAWPMFQNLNFHSVFSKWKNQFEPVLCFRNSHKNNQILLTCAKKAKPKKYACWLLTNRNMRKKPHVVNQFSNQLTARVQTVLYIETFFWFTLLP